MKLTFRAKLFSYFVIIILFTSIPIVIINYNHNYDLIKNDLSSNAQSQMKQVDTVFSDIVKQMKEDTTRLANYSNIVKADESISALFNIPDIELHNKYSKQILGLESTIYNHFESYGTTHPKTTHVYLGTKWGGYIQWPDGLSASKFDPRETPWYKLALDNPNEVSITNAYTSEIDDSNKVISTSTPIKNTSGDIVGVMGIDVSLEKLSSIIRNIKIGDTGYVFLFLKDGTMLAHPNADLNFKNIMQLNQLGYISNKIDEGSKYSFENYNKLLEGDSSTFETEINGFPVIVNVYTSPYTGWKMASVIQKSELSYRVNKNSYLVGFITLCVFLFVIGLTIIIINRITKPIETLTPLMNAAGQGDLTAMANIKTNDEFGQLGNSYNLMISQMSSSYDELSAVYEELVATEEELKAQYDELQYNEEALRNSDERYRLALECANDSIWQWNIITDEFFITDKFHHMTGYKINNTNNKFTETFRVLIHPDDRLIASKDLEDHLNNITQVYKSEFRIKINDGSYVWILSRGKAIRDSEDKVIKLAGSITDISDRKISEDKIKFMAYYDSLTKLPNRTLFTNKLNEQLQLLNSENAEGAVFFIDLDNFKNINDTLGHEYGDKLLIHLAKEFESLIEEKDTICRFGGDEFILLYPDANESNIEDYAKKLLNLFNKLFEIKDRQIYTTASIGIALYPKDGTDTNTILKNADSAMYKAKELGKNRYMLFDPEMYLELERKICIERILRTAIENNELSINYQPQYDAQNNKIFGFEALVRLNSKELGFISPLEFIPIAEQCGFITKLGKWVFDESCKQSIKWLNEGYKFKSMSINISPVDLQQPDFLENIKEVLEKTSIDPSVIELEITETVLMQSFDNSIEVLNKLMDIGVRIALDDFGTGYSSLNYLRKIPISTLKIDKSFIDNITLNKKEEAIINNIIQMAHAMDLRVVAEGVETEDQLTILKDRKCDYIQGYYFSRPLSASEVEKLMVKEDV